jgi:hypothetical protein
VLHSIGDWLYKYTGSAGSGSWYGFWSGFGSDLGEAAIIGGLIQMYRKHNCAVLHCWRVGHRQVPGTDHVVCRKHHPNPPPTHDQVLADHAAAQPKPRAAAKK